MHIDYIRQASAEIRRGDGGSSANLRIELSWEDGEACGRLYNDGYDAAVIAEIVLFKGAWPFGSKTKFYGEGYNMLSQYGGTIGSPRSIGGYDDRKHYKLKATEPFFTVYNMALLSGEAGGHTLLGFTSCERLSGEIRLADGHFEVVLDGESLTLEPGASWKLERFLAVAGEDREALLERFAERIEQAHPKLPYPEVPNGWCSWYCFGPAVTEQHIADNLQAISEHAPQLKYIQIDDGYQAYMGDWLTPGHSFSDMERLCKLILDNGFEPAIWVAPFIAQAESALFREHPDWFVQDEAGKPLPSNRHSFGGWREGPWYMLDGTHPEARRYLTHVFRTMREKWSCRYFKLDANMWGALPGGVRFDKQASKVEAYRLGMQAVLEGAGEDSFLLGCNAPMWPSLGTVHGMRITGDIARKWPVFARLAEECFSRNWQHNRLWINDPDCIVLENRDIKLVDPDGTVRRGLSSITPDEFTFHAAHIVASGGMLLSGDDVCTMAPGNIALVRRALDTPFTAARFDDDSFRIGRIADGDRKLVCLFNWNEEEQTVHVPCVVLPGKLADFWTGEQLGSPESGVTVTETGFVVQRMPPHSGRIVAVL